MLDNTQSIICAFGLAAAVPRSPYRHLELCGIALKRCVSGFAGWRAESFSADCFASAPSKELYAANGRGFILPHPRKQSTGPFVSRCGESGLFECRHSVKNKKLFHQTVKELFVVGVTGFEPTASWSRTKRATNCATPRKKIRSNFAAAVVGDERIELPQTESESVALPLCKSPLHVC